MMGALLTPTLCTQEAPWTLDATLEEGEGWRNPEMPGIHVLHPLKSGHVTARPLSTPSPGLGQDRR